jgi:hypothetical protein
VLLRDLIIFEIKLFLDGLGDVLLSQLALLAFLFDFLRGGPGRGRLFYSILRAGERWDLWLNLYGPAEDAETSGEGLLGAGASSADGLLLKLQELTKRRQPSRDRSEDERGDLSPDAEHDPRG